MENATPAVSLTPQRGQVDTENEVSTFGLHVSDAGDYHLRIQGSAPLAATLMDADGVTVSATDDAEAIDRLELDLKLTPGTYTLHVRAAEVGEAATIEVDVAPAD